MSEKTKKEALLELLTDMNFDVSNVKITITLKPEKVTKQGKQETDKQK